MKRLLGFTLLLALSGAGCTFSHSKQALFAGPVPEPQTDATFVSSEDSGLSLFGLITLTEPDHYAVLLERARKRYQCTRMYDAQLDFYTEHWVIVAFPVSRITMICEHAPGPRATP